MYKSGLHESLNTYYLELLKHGCEPVRRWDKIMRGISVRLKLGVIRELQLEMKGREFPSPPTNVKMAMEEYAECD